MSLFTTCLVVAAVALLAAWPVALWREKRTFSRPAAAFLRLHPAGKVTVAILVALALRAGGSKRASPDGDSCQDASALRESVGVPRQVLPTDGNTNAFAITFFDLDSASSNLTFGVSWDANAFENADSRNVAMFSSSNLLARTWTFAGEYPMPTNTTSHTFTVSATNVFPSAHSAFLDSFAGRGFYRFGLDVDTDGDGLSDIFERIVSLSNPFEPDSDLDGLPDGVEWSLGTDPAERDTDGDWFVDGSDPDPLATTAPDDLDGDGIPDAYEIHWFGRTDAVESAETLGLNGFTVGFDLAAGINPTNAAESAFMPTNGIVAWKIADAFMALGPGDTNNVYERTFDITRHGGWEQFFVSSRPDRAGGWSLQGLVMEWEDSEGVAGSAASSPDGDSLHLSLSTNSPERLTVRLSPVAIENACRTPLYLLAYSPGVAVDDAQTVATSDGAWIVAEIKEETTLPVTIDRVGRPCEAGLYRQELDAELVTGDGNLRLRAGGTMRVEAPGVYELPGFVPMTCSQPRLRGERTFSQPPSQATNSFRIAILNPSISYGKWHGGSIHGLSYSHATGLYSETSDYPLDSECLRRSWHVDASGGYSCSCEPELSVGFEIDGYTDFATNIVVGSEGATGTVSVGGVQVWSGTAKHDVSTLGAAWPEPLDGDGCDDCSGCEDGNCDSLEGGGLGSLKFRIPLGVPRKGQVSGFAWFMAKEPLTIGVDTLQVMGRVDAQVADTLAGGVRTIVCGDNRGRTLSIQPVASGIEVMITETDTGKLEHTWRIQNDNGSASQIRLCKISRLNNTMSDETYVYDNGDWTKFDNISQTSEELVATGDINEDGYKREERILRDADNVTLSHTITESHRFGSFANAALRQTYYAEKSWGEDNWNESFASYYTDNDNPKRNGNVRLERGNARAWRFSAYDADGRTILTLDQHDGSWCPEWPLDYMDADAFDSQDIVQWLGNQWFTAVATVYDYTPLAGDDAASVDADKVRTESRYLVEDGTVTLIGRTWTRYTHGAANGYATVTVETTTAGAQDAAIGDACNARRVETRYDEDAAGVPLMLRGEIVEELDDDGTLTQNTYSISNGVVSCTSQRSYMSHPFPVATVTERDATYGNVLREWCVHTLSGIAFDERRHLYDDKNRLRSTIYADGSFTTNAYSCCRLLWSQDRTGRKVLRSAVTGQDHLYYAEEEVSLADLPHDYGNAGWQFGQDGTYRVTQHFMDALGRETCTTVRTCDSPGAATNSVWNCNGLSTFEFTEYPYGVSDYAVATDMRGNETTTIHTMYQDRECVASIESNKTTTVTMYRNGPTVTREEWLDGKWKETTRTDSYDGNGCRVETSTMEASDHVSWPYRIARYDFLGRIVQVITQLSDTCYFYQGSTSRISLSVDSAAEEWKAPIYNELGEAVGERENAVSSRDDTSYEVESNMLWRVNTHTVALSVTNYCSVTKERLTGLSNELRGETYSYVNGTLAGHAYSCFEPTNGVLTEVSESAATGIKTTKSMFGVETETSTCGGARERFFDPYGRIRCVKKDGRLVEAICYDDLGDVEEHMVNDDNCRFVKHYLYDCFGNIRYASNTVGGSTEYSYDAEHRVLESCGESHPARYCYDTDGRRTVLSTTRDDANWDSTHWAFDQWSGLCLQKTYPDGTFVTYTYTADGKLRRTTSFCDRWVEYAYGAKHKIVSTAYSDGEVSLYSYDEFLQQIAASNAIGSTRMFRNVYGQVTNEATVVGNQNRTLGRAYDGLGRTIEIDGLDYAYAPDGQVASIGNAFAGVEYLYSADRLDLGYALSLSNGVVFTRGLARDGGSRSLVVAITNSVNGSCVEELTYSYDALGRPETRNEDFFTYNAQNELMEAFVSGHYIIYRYDGIGNVQSVFSVDDGSGYYAANSCNQYTNIGFTTYSPYQTIGGSVAYDQDGNMTLFDRWNYSYDAASRLKTVSTNGVVLVMNFYDAKSRRVKKVTPEATHTFFYDDWNLIEERVAYTNGTSSTIHYYWGKDLSGTLQGAGGIGGLLYITVSDSSTPTSSTHQLYVPFYDNIGNVTRYLDENGNTVAQYTYGGFGNLIAKSGPLADFFRHRFSTKYFDAETGLYYYGYRFYLPPLMRWLTRDPIEEEGGLNLYGFCGNDPICESDILGLKWKILRDGKTFATAIPQDSGDTFEMLAREVGLDLSDYTKWAHTSDRTPILCKKYQIPNVKIYHKGVRRFYENWGNNIIGAWDSENLVRIDKERNIGYNVILKETVSDVDVMTDLGTDGLYEYTFTGHGHEGSIAAESKTYPFGPRRITLYGIHKLTLQACDSFNDMARRRNVLSPGWAANVATVGLFVGYIGEVRLIHSPEKSRRIRRGTNSGDMIILRGENK